MTDVALNYDKDIRIEADALDIEWLQQPRLYMKWAEMASKADAEVRRAKEELNIVDAGIDIEIRSKEGKTTESMIKAEIAINLKHKEATEKYHKALYNADICSAAVKAMEQKKYALENEVRLWAGSYFAGPKEPKDLKEKLNMRENGLQAETGRVRKRMEEKLKNNAIDEKERQ